MCTLVILRRPGHPWPLILAANRDEMKDRPWRPPARHWPDRPQIVGGQDKNAGGSWLGVNDQGLVAGVLNRTGSLGPEPGKRSRGELVLMALDHSDATAAATAISHVDPNDYRSFNLVVGDRKNAFWLPSLGKTSEAPRIPSQGRYAIEIFELAQGVSMITAHDRNDPLSPRIKANLPRFEAAQAPDPRTGAWGSWQEILASRGHAASNDEEAAMTVVTDFGFGTVSSSLIALPGLPQSARERSSAPVWLFAPGPPDAALYERVAI